MSVTRGRRESARPREWRTTNVEASMLKGPMTAAQAKLLRQLCRSAGLKFDTSWDKAHASRLITYLTTGKAA